MRVQDRELTREAFERFLDWLDINREQAGRKYEAIRQGLITFFNCRGCAAAEDLTDEVINRAIRQLASIADSYQGDPASYLHGIARFVALEYFNRQVKRDGGPVPENLPDDLHIDTESEKEDISRCLRLCLGKLKPEKRKLFILYYRKGNHVDLKHRQSLAERFGYSINALRIQIYRLNEEMRLCITDCCGR